MNALWIRNCSVYNEPITSYEVGGLAHSWQTLMHMQHLESMMSHQNSDSINRCTLTWRTILTNFIPIRFEAMEP